MAGSGGCQQVHLQDCRYMQAHLQMNSSIHTLLLWDLSLMHMLKNHPALHPNWRLLELHTQSPIEVTPSKV
jgi:hypothetical protein